MTVRHGSDVDHVSFEELNDAVAAMRERALAIRAEGPVKGVSSLRDYGPAPARGTEEIKDYGDRIWEGRVCRLRQIWRWRGPIYDVVFELVATGDSAEVILRTPSTTYLAVSVARVATLMGAVGFSCVRRVDGCLFQPVLVGTRYPEV